MCSGALVSHAFELDSKVRTLFYGAPAVITFRVPTKTALQVWHCQLFHLHTEELCIHYALQHLLVCIDKTFLCFQFSGGLFNSDSTFRYSCG